MQQTQKLHVFNHRLSNKQ